MLAALALLSTIVSEVHGTVVLVASDGSRAMPRDGWIEVLDEPGDEVRTVPVRNGKWAYDDAGSLPNRISAYPARLEGRDCVVVGRHYDTRASNGVELCARVVAPVHLGVVDATSGRALEDVEVLRCKWFPDELRFTTPVAAHARAPVAIDPWAGADDARRWWPGRTRHWVRAPGRAWTAVDFDPLAGGEISVLLERGASLELAFGGQLDTERTELELERDGGEPRVRRRLRARDALRFESLPAGTWHAEVRCDDGGGEPIVVGRRSIVLGAGDVASAEIALDAPPPFVERSSRPVRGRVACANEWSARPAAIILSRRGETPRGCPIDRCTGAFDVGVLETGSWIARVEPQGVESELYVSRRMRPGLEIDVGSPCLVRVSAREAVTGGEVELERVVWSWRGSGARRPMRRWLGGPFTGELPRGEIVIAGRSALHACRPARVVLDSDHVELVLEAHRIRTFLTGVERGGVAVAPDPSWRVHAHRLDAPANVVAQRTESDKIRVDVDADGRWLAWIEGRGAPNGVITIDVEWDELATATFRLDE